MRSGALWVLGLLTISLDALVWGVAACTAYRALRGSGGRALGPALVAGLIFVVWDQWLFGEFAHWVGFPRGHAEPGRWLEAAVGLAAAVAGFRGGEALLGAIARRREENEGRAAAAHASSPASRRGPTERAGAVADPPSEPRP